MRENCRSCSNNLSKNYLTIWCAIWTPKMKVYGYTNDDQCRLPSLIRCQFYKKDEGLYPIDKE